MDEQEFSELLQSIRWMKRHQAGKESGARTTKIEPVDVKETRKRTGLSQAKFASLIQVSKGTLVNWEQGRRSPTGPARALLRAVAVDPENVLKALNR